MTRKLVTCVFRLVLVMAMGPIASPRAVGETRSTNDAIGWRNLSSIFNQRWQARSPNRYDDKFANIDRRVTSDFRLNPVLEASKAITRGEKADGAETYSDNSRASLAVTQGTPWGSQLSVSTTHDGTQVRDSHPSLPTDMNPITADSMLETRSRQSSVTNAVTFSQEILKGGPYGGLAEYENKNLIQKKALLEAEKRSNEAFLGVLKAFTAVINAQRSLEIAQKSLVDAENTHKTVHELVNKGYKAKADTLVSQASLIDAGETLRNAENMLKSSYDALGEALWQRRSDPPLIYDGLDIPLDLEKRVNQHLVDDYQSLDEKALHLRSQQNEVTFLLARRERLPSLNFSYTLSQENATQYPQAGASQTTEGLNHTYALNFQMPLGDTFGASNYTRAALQNVVDDATAAQERERIMNNKQTLARNLSLAEKTLESALKLYELELKTYEIEKQRYSDGRTSISELNQSQARLIERELNVSQARQQLIMAKFNLINDAGLIQRVFP